MCSLMSACVIVKPAESFWWCVCLTCHGYGSRMHWSAHWGWILPYVIMNVGKFVFQKKP